MRDDAGRILDERRTEIAPDALPATVIIDDERRLALHDAVHLMLNKPLGVVTALRDERHPTAFALVEGAPLASELRAVGRLDLDTSGLLLWTTDGQWVQRLTHPKRQIPRTYQAALARPFGKVPADFALEDGHRPTITALDVVDLKRAPPVAGDARRRDRVGTDHRRRRRLSRSAADLRCAGQPRAGPVPDRLRSARASTRPRARNPRHRRSRERSSSGTLTPDAPGVSAGSDLRGDFRHRRRGGAALRPPRRTRSTWSAATPTSSRGSAPARRSSPDRGRARRPRRHRAAADGRRRDRRPRWCRHRDHRPRLARRSAGDRARDDGQSG